MGVPRAIFTGVLCLAGFAYLQPTGAIDTVQELEVSKYLGRWYQAYGNTFTMSTIAPGATCIAADYGLDEATGNITVINSDRELMPTGELNTITGYAYPTVKSQPGKLKVHLGQVPFDGDYWIVALGPKSYGPEGAYEWAVVTDSQAMNLFILVRDVEDFEDRFAQGVLALVDDLGFNSPLTSPVPVVQEGCLPFVPEHDSIEMEPYLYSELYNEEGHGGYDAHTYMDFHRGRGKKESKVAASVGGAGWLGGLLNSMVSLPSPPETVYCLDVDRYAGRWYQAYGSLSSSVILEQSGACVTADYSPESDDSITVSNTARIKGPNGKRIVITGSARVVDPNEPGKLLVLLEGMPFEAPYWVLALGEDGQDDPYKWSIVSDPLRAFLFVLVRDVNAFKGSADEQVVLSLLEDLKFNKPWNRPRATEQDGCRHTLTPLQESSVQGQGKGLRGGTVMNVDQSQPTAKLEEVQYIEETMGGHVEGGRIAGDVSPAAFREQVLGMYIGGPLHASCKVSWTFPSSSCESVSTALVAAAESMRGFDSCNGGNKCGYSVVGAPTTASAKFVHETSVKHYLDDMEITFADEDGSCEAVGKSRSRTWYAVLDNSVNYCNLRNLVEATGLDYTESGVSDSVCTQYSSANCERY